MDKGLEQLELEFLRELFAFQPGTALTAGNHEHDQRLGDLRPIAIEAFCARLDRIRVEIESLSDLNRADEIEREVFVSRLDQVLNEHRVAPFWRRDPRSYVEELSSQLNLLLIFDFAAPEQRLRSVIAKEREVRGYLDVARSNLQGVPPILINYGVRSSRGALSLVANDLPAAFAGVGSEELIAEFARATAEASAALEEFGVWLERVCPRGPAGSHALGVDAYAAWLAAGERVTTPLPELEGWALNEIAKTRAAMLETCRAIDATADPARLVEGITANHPRTGDVVREARRLAEQVYAWVRERNLVSFPSDARVRIADTPEFMRWSFGSMWSPGPWEQADVAATFYATDADPTWPEPQQDEHLTAFCYRGLENLAVHEAYPGHFIQNQHQNQVASPIRKTFWWGVFGEGWAHYCEQMVVDEGFGEGAPEVRIIQLQEALNRLCRFVNGIRIHTSDDWDFDRGTRFFQEQAWLTEAVARAESERAAIDPFYLRYSLGKKAILDIREELKRELGDRFDLRAFHDALLGAGSGPMSAMRELVRLALAVPR